MLHALRLLELSNRGTVQAVRDTPADALLLRLLCLLPNARLPAFVSLWRKS